MVKKKKFSSDHTHLPLRDFTLQKQCFFIFLLGLCCFASSYSNSFTFDDTEAIINNRDVTNDTGYKMWSHDFWGTNVSSPKSHKSYRPLTVLTFRWNFLLASGLHPMGFHITNIIIHAVVSVLFLCLVHKLVREFTEKHYNNNRLAFMAAILFTVHPIHAENVASVVGRADLLCASMDFTALLCYIEACNTKNSHVSTLLLLFGCCACSLLAVLFKEQGITVLGLCFVFDVLYQQQRYLKSHRLHRILTAKDIVNICCSLSFVVRTLVLFIFGVLLLFFRWSIMGYEAPTFQPTDNPASFINSTLYRIINYNYLYCINCWLLINPWWLCFDWSMGCIPLITEISDPRVIFVIAFWVILSLLVYRCIRSFLSSAHDHVYIIAMATVIVTFLPASNVVFVVGFVIAERNLYLPSAGFVLCVTIAVNHLQSISERANKIVSICFYTLVVLFFCRSIQRSLDWSTPLGLYTSAQLVCPLNAKVHYNIGKVLTDDNGDIEQAVDSYRTAIKLNPLYDQALNNLANILKDQGQFAEAKVLLERAVDIRPSFAAAWMNLAIVQTSLLSYTKAEYSYKQALMHRQNYPDCYFNLGNLYNDQGLHLQALVAWQNATQLNRFHSNSWNNMILLLDNLGRIEEMDIIAREALKHVPNDPHLHYNIANSYGKLSRYEDSERHFLRAVQLQPNNYNYHSNLGVLYHRWKKYAESEQSYRQALKINPNAQQTIENFNMLLRKMNKPTL